MESVPLTLNIASALLGSISTIYFAYKVYIKEQQANSTTWFIFVALDFVGLYLAFKTGNADSYIQIGWCVAATITLAAAIKTKASWEWSKIDFLVLAASGLSVVIWLTSGSVVLSLVGYVSAALISIVPQLGDYKKNPGMAIKSLWLWLVSATSISMSIGSKILKDETGFEHLFVYIALMAFNLAVASYIYTVWRSEAGK